MYDYIIIGAGSSGCVLAHRLTEEASKTVLLIEAGGPDSAREIHVPAAFAKLFQTTNDWAYLTEAQPRLHNRQLFWPRGRVLGGCSSTNAMIYIRGHQYDYDEWQRLGNAGWGYRDVLPYFKRSVTQEQGDADYRGTEGPLNVATLRYTNPLSRAFIESCLEAGFTRTNDFNGERQEGVGFYQVTQRNGQRHSAAAAYLKPVLSRRNLTVRTHTQVTRILFEGTRAVGVEYIHNNSKEQVRAACEVILSGGAVNSPQLLMLSGIGPADHLQELGIPVTVDLPGVGQNLQDHLMLAVVYRSREPVSLSGADSIGNIIKYLLFKSGPLTSNIGEAGGFVKTRPDLPVPDIQLIFGPVFYINHGFTKPAGDSHGFTIGPTLLRPLSRGQITLKSADPLAPPRIEPNYLEKAEDLNTLVAGCRIARRIAQAKAFDRLRGEELHPGPGPDSDERLADFVRGMVETLYHPVGTCKMGSDAMAVVDTELRVRGTQGLRVVDCSIMPTIVGGNTNAPAIMIGERAADMIKRGASAPALAVEKA